MTRTPPPNPDSFLTVSDIVAEIGLCRQTITKLIDAGELPGQRIAGKVRISRLQWDDFRRTGTWAGRPPKQDAASSPEPMRFIRRKTA